jgi:hypothetical protein
MNEIKRHILEGELVDDDPECKMSNEVLFGFAVTDPTPWVDPSMTPEFMDRMNQRECARQAKKSRFELFLVFCFVVVVVLVISLIAAGYGEYILYPLMAFTSTFVATASVGFVINRM